MREQIAKDPFMKKCIRAHEGNCSPDITWEHAWIYAGRQINEPWAIVPLCSHHHFKDLNKNYNRLVALERATKEDLKKYPKVDWEQKLRGLRYMLRG